jgi:hypothetical protein
MLLAGHVLHHLLVTFWSARGGGLILPLSDASARLMLCNILLAQQIFLAVDLSACVALVKHI